MIEAEKKSEILDKQDLVENQVDIVATEPVFVEKEQKPAATFYPIDNPKDEYVEIYSGQALTAEQLFRFSAKEDVNVTLIAGPYSSGKTTLIVMLYRLFLAGYNKKLQFAGSITIGGFENRSKDLLCKSGNAEPLGTRTSRMAEDRYLHLIIASEPRTVQNLFFADISGETFSDDRSMETIAECFEDTENVIVVVDGEKLCNNSEKQKTKYATKMLLKRLLNKKILSKRTKLQIIFTKKDKIEQSEQKEQVIEMMKEMEQTFCTSLEAYVYSIKCLSISALSTAEEECEKLEIILQNCMEKTKKEDSIPLEMEQFKIKRNFDKFQMRG